MFQKLKLIAALSVVAFAAPLAAQDMSDNTMAMSSNGDVMVGGREMSRGKDIIDNADNTADHTTLVAAVKAADLECTLNGKGPITVFEPTNEAFAALPAGTVDNLLKPENKPALTKVLTYHVVAGKYDYAALQDAIRKGHGTAVLPTVSGGKLWARMNGPRNIVLQDEANNVSTISVYDVYQSNGVIQVVDKVLMQKM
jgi:uncharacterized surface protein with fasciclin (FAS1) repeats